MAAAVVLENLTKVYRAFWRRRRVRAVDGLSLEVEAGEIFGLLGPNGSGKTTTIQILLGLMAPTSGAVRVLGGAPGERSGRRRTGYLPEEFSGYEFLSGEENLRFYGGFYRLGRAEVERRAAELLRLLDLWDDRRRRLRDYSKGMRRRIGLAQCLLHDPELIVLDEPTNGLDPLGIRKVLDLLRGLRARGRTVLIASHILPELESICDRVAILDRGKKLISGRLDALLTRPRRHRIVVEGTPPPPAEVAALLAPRGLEVRSIEPERATLEELFLETLRAQGH